MDFHGGKVDTGNGSCGVGKLYSGQDGHLRVGESIHGIEDTGSSNVRRFSWNEEVVTDTEFAEELRGIEYSVNDGESEFGGDVALNKDEEVSNEGHGGGRVDMPVEGL